MEPLSGFFFHSRLSALMHVAIHDAMNAIPEHARYETYLPPVATECPANPRAALAAAGRTMLIKYIDFYSDPSLPPPFYNSILEDMRPHVESLYAAQLAAIPDGPAKTEGIRVGCATATQLWDQRLDDGWDSADAVPWVWPNDDGDNNPMTDGPLMGGVPGRGVRRPAHVRAAARQRLRSE
jgi:hypothetical protein